MNSVLTINANWRVLVIVGVALALVFLGGIASLSGSISTAHAQAQGPTPTATATTTPTATAAPSYTSLSATTHSDIVGVPVQIKVANLRTDSCLDLMIDYGVQTRKGVTHTDCDVTKDGQAWKFEAYEDGWQIKSKDGSKVSGTVFPDYYTCMSSGGWERSRFEGLLPFSFTFHHNCYEPGHEYSDDQEYIIRQRSSDNKWEILVSDAMGLRDNGPNKIIAHIKRGMWMTFEITPISEIPATTVTPTYTALDTSSSLANVDVQLKLVGRDNACLYIETDSSVRRTTCKGNDDKHIWKMVAFDGAWQIQTKNAGSGSSYSRCLDTEGSHVDEDNLTHASLFVRDCMTATDTDKEDQKFTIDQRSTDNRYVLWAGSGIGIEDWGNTVQVGLSKTNFRAFDIRTISSLGLVTPIVTPTATATTTPTPTPHPAYTNPTYWDENSALNGVDLQIQVDGTDRCLGVASAEAGQAITNTDCDGSDLQTWQITKDTITVGSGFVITLKAGGGSDGTTAMCLETRKDVDSWNLENSEFDLRACQTTTKSPSQSFDLIQSTVDTSDWYITSEDTVMVEEISSGFYLLKWSGTLFTITTVTSSNITPTATATATATATPTVTPSPTPVALSSDLIGVDVTIKVAGSNDCMDLKFGDPRNGQNIWRYACNGTDAQTFRINAFNGGYQIMVKQRAAQAGALNSTPHFTKCLDSRGDHTKSDLTGSRLDVWSCVSATHSARDNQTFFIEGAQGSTWHIYTADGVGVKDQGNAQNFTQDDSTYTRFEITVVVGGV